MGSKRVFELILEIGNVSKPLSKKLPNGYTHKWTAFVRGHNNSKIEHCIQRVVFQLHESFDNPFRDISEPPFQVKETGYAGFEIPIHIHFKNKEKPNHLTFVHDLCLLTNKPNESKTIEKIKFINPTREFEKCLVKSGAQLLTVPVEKKRSDSPPAKKQKSSSLIPSKDMAKLSQQQSQSIISSSQQTSQLLNKQTSPQSPFQTNTNSHSNSTSHNNNHNHVTSQQHMTSQNHHNHHHHKSSSSSSITTSTSNQNTHHSSHQLQHHNTNGLGAYSSGSGGGGSHNSHHALSTSSTKHQSQQQSGHSVLQKPKSSSREFIDVFGAPLMVNGNGKDIKSETTSSGSSNSKDNSKKEHHNQHNHSSSHQQQQSQPKNQQQLDRKLERHSEKLKEQTHQKHHHHNNHHHSSGSSNSNSNSNHNSHHHGNHNHKQEVKQNNVNNKVVDNDINNKIDVESEMEIVQTQFNDQSYIDDLQLIQTKISCLTDCDRLQKIVDIVEEAGEYNLTSKKFEFDLKRLDKKTLSRIESCLH